MTNVCGFIVKTDAMKTWIKRFIFILMPFFCAFECEDGSTSYYVQNSTEETVIIKTGGYTSYLIPALNVELEPGEMVEIYRCHGLSNVYQLKGLDVSLYTQDDVLLRYWTFKNAPDEIEAALEGCYASYFRSFDVRQFHDVFQWKCEEEYEDLEYTFQILPEDLIPLCEICDNGNR